MRYKTLLLGLLLSGAALADDPHARGPVMPAQGTDVVSVDAAFTGVILWEFQTNATIDTQVTQLQDNELIELAQRYAALGGDVYSLSGFAAERLSAKNLVRWQAAFGPGVTNATVTLYAPAAIAAAYFAAPALKTLVMHAQVVGTNYLPQPTLDMTTYEIFTEYRLTLGSSLASALYNTAMYMSGPLGKAFSGGYAIGTALFSVAQYFNPDFAYTLVTTVGASLTDGLGIIIFPPLPSGTITVGPPIDPDPTWVYSDCMALADYC